MASQKQRQSTGAPIPKPDTSGGPPKSQVAPKKPAAKQITQESIAQQRVKRLKERVRKGRGKE